eukprot:PLAT3566.1.p1 GENE.PLAT3566.1~~PLAT3566.1.p1  ORF type:complete len:553 (+),score=203.33 PLAT3566.1:140-1798(+)
MGEEVVVPPFPQAPPCLDALSRGDVCSILRSLRLAKPGDEEAREDGSNAAFATWAYHLACLTRAEVLCMCESCLARERTEEETMAAMEAAETTAVDLLRRAALVAPTGSPLAAAVAHTLKLSVAEKRNGDGAKAALRPLQSSEEYSRAASLCDVGAKALRKQNWAQARKLLQSGRDALEAICGPWTAPSCVLSSQLAWCEAQIDRSTDACLAAHYSSMLWEVCVWGPHAPSSGSACLQLAHSLRQRDELSSAVFAFRHCVRTTRERAAGNSVDALLGIAACLGELDDHSRAASVARAAEKLALSSFGESDERYWMALALLAGLWQALQQPEPAKECVEAALNLSAAVIKDKKTWEGHPAVRRARAESAALERVTSIDSAFTAEESLIDRVLSAIADICCCRRMRARKEVDTADILRAVEAAEADDNDVSSRLSVFGEDEDGDDSEDASEGKGESEGEGEAAEAGSGKSEAEKDNSRPATQVLDAADLKALLQSAFACKRCGKHGKLNTCRACGSARYCSRACQKADWPSHRAECKKLAAAAAAAAAAATASS